MTELVICWLVFRNFAHFAHINVQGGHFFTLHQEFKTLYEGALDRVDEIAERYKQINPDADLQITCPEITYPISDNRELIREAIKQLRTLREMQNEIWAQTNSNGDYVTNDLMVQCSKFVDFHVWQLTEFLK